ncbi:hypothetical protein K3152_10025 [Qipengyuania sp. 1NDH17]|uniref:Uncharacterized protein n=1 Tax=Qipengyuania polymorpha TaxID=2867234 RepID=A0ABS7IYE5_9SPHN|nr:hypothetical protein [Qipengyuania polymorpha]MBX7458581.1 hypothetical protein [Qipengyuania polymorpha]
MGDGFENTGLMRRAWFKPMVGAWFALLLGGGLWLMPPHIHALISDATQLSALHPMFAPPVSAGGAAVMALVAGLFGFFLGIAVAGRVAAASAPRAFAPGFEMHGQSVWDDEREEAAFEEPRRRRVFSAREDIGEEGIAISAPTGDEEGDYEDEYSIEDIPPATPEEDFEAVYAEMDEDYVASEYEPEEVVSVEEPVVEEAFDHEEPAGTPAFVEDAEYEEVEDLEAAPEPEPGPEQQPELEVEAEVGHEPEQVWEPHTEAEAEFEPETETEPEPVYAPENAEAKEATDVADEPLEESEALGDMSLEALLGRLEGALEQHKKMVAGSEEAAQQPAPQPVPLVREPAPAPEDISGEELPEASDDDPVIAFLRREASRRMPPPPASEMDDGVVEDEPRQQSQTDAQAALRSALDRLGQVNRRD